MYNEQEKKLMLPLMLFKEKTGGKEFIFEYIDKTIIKAIYNTSFESDNGLDLDEEGYEEYWACAFELKKILKHGNSVPCKVGELFELNYRNFPKVIKNSVGEIIVENIYI